MAATQLEVTIRHLPGVAILALRGEINAFAEQALETAYSEASSQKPGTILLDFRQVDYINSTGIALIVGMMSQARQADCRLIACGLSEHYQEIFRITRLDEFMPVYPDEASALAVPSALGTATAPLT
jgi:anti-sigma B factor antagonist